MSDAIYVGESRLKAELKQISGEFVRINEKDFYKINNYDRMRPFFMTLVSHSNHWMFISSTGGLTAGRKNENSALFPYYTDDKISDSYDQCGSKSIFRIASQGKLHLWEPFTSRYKGLYSLSRNIYKSVIGDILIFEEINHDLNLRFAYSWQFSDKFGFVRSAELQNLGNEDQTIDILDGIQNVLPYGINSDLQNSRSNLVNAYKKNELDIDSGLGMILLSAIIVDRAEPSEALKATTVWSSGIKPEKYLLSSRQLEDFRVGGEIVNEENVRAEPGAFFLYSRQKLSGSSKRSWKIIAEVNQGSTDVHNLIIKLNDDREGLIEELRTDLISGEEKLKILVCTADGIQKTNDKSNDSRHFTNVLFNIMRGGLFDEGYTIERQDFDAYLKSVNTGFYGNFQSFVDSLPVKLEHPDLIERVFENGNPDLIRISLDYLPLTFSRRHGDPSRPWNKFSIETKKEDGTKNLSYQGNWRDIFQNWEALAYSCPDYIHSMISKFLNASTADGYNPYRITREGVDWEVIDPEDPWSYIGYWGDHQIIYLLKLLEIAYSHSKEQFIQFLNQPWFVYANVPYRIKSYNEIIENPKDTIVFDQNCEVETEKRFDAIGSDGKLVYDSKGKLLKASLAEKLLLTLLTKLSNFVPEGGIWLNTQRPEWNDANNALVGNGVSMVTLYYIRRYVHFCMKLFSDGRDDFMVNSAIRDFFKAVSDSLESNKSLLRGDLTNRDRKSMMDQLGMAGEAYRQKAYMAFAGSETVILNKEEIHGFLETVEAFIDHTIKANRREDGLFHAYNLLEIRSEEAKISNLYEMLEGQVAVLTSGFLSASEVAGLMSALRQSSIYRVDQNSYLLYPNRKIPHFLEKNNIPASFIEKSELAAELLKNGDISVIRKDSNGGYHFNGSFTNAEGLKEALNRLKDQGYEKLVDQEWSAYLEIFETMFRHREFTGRSGTFFGYEGLGSIYWHMVSKLLLAIQENIRKARKTGDDAILDELIRQYRAVREGIGAHKSPELYGAFPIDPYSHTPAHKGAQQPGMTGQVKEDVINRWAELGVFVEEGKLLFDPVLLSEEEFLKNESDFEFFDVEGIRQRIALQKGELAFTYCQVPIVYQSGKNNEINVEMATGERRSFDKLQLDGNTSKQIFGRTGEVQLIRVELLM
jgi:hypothetical protein